MADVRVLLANIRKNIPPLKQTSLNKSSNEDIILIERKKDSILDKWMQHRNLNGQTNNVDGEDCQKRSSIESWLQIKEKMLVDMEQKRNQEWEEQQTIIKIQNEEEEELEADLTDEDDEKNVEDNENDIDEPTEEPNEDGEDNQEEDKEEEESLDNDENNDEEIVQIESPLNDSISHSSEKNDDKSDNENDDEPIFSLKRTKAITIEDEDEEDEADGHQLTELAQNENFNRKEQDNQIDNDDRFFISQNLPLTPICTPAITKDNIQLTENSNNNYDSQMLLELCSGNFDSGNVVDKPDIVDEDEDEDASSKNSDEEQEELEENSEDEDNQEEYENQKKPAMKARDFIEDEAELSGDEGDISSDENDDGDDKEFIEDLIQEGALSEDEDEIRNQVEKIYNKNMLDEDKRQLMIMKEYLFEDGDLYDGESRKRKFKWNLEEQDLTDLVNVSSDSDSDSQHDDNDDDEQNMTKTIRLKRTIDQVDEDDDQENDSLIHRDDDDEDQSEKVTKKRPKEDERLERLRALTLNSKFMLNQQAKKKCQSTLNSFLIRDKRLSMVMQSSTSSTNESNLRKKSEKNGSVSIFDVI